LTIFRVAQDVLSGIVARGGARNVEVVVEPHEGESGADGYLMTIGDDGAAADATADALLTARHRVALAGGRIETESRPGTDGEPGGNRVRVFVPRSAAGSA
jgi:glucose-6-phosphate-specific signal transduction histidine kinase